MSTPRTAARAYAAAATHRNLREQEADVFRRANIALRQARGGGDIAHARAVADNERLWTLVLDLVRDPANGLPAPLLAAIASIGFVVQRELRATVPDLEFVAAMNENIAKGLAGHG